MNGFQVLSNIPSEWENCEDPNGNCPYNIYCIAHIGHGVRCGNFLDGMVVIEIVKVIFDSHAACT